MCYAIEFYIKTRKTKKSTESVLARKKGGMLAWFRASPRTSQQKNSIAAEWAVAPPFRKKDRIWAAVNYVRRRMCAIFYQFGGCTIILSKEHPQRVEEYNANSPFRTIRYR